MTRPPSRCSGEVGERAQRRASPVAAAAHLDAGQLAGSGTSRARDRGAPLGVKTEFRHAPSDHGFDRPARPLVESEPIREELRTAFAQGRRGSEPGFLPGRLPVPGAGSTTRPHDEEAATPVMAGRCRAGMRWPASPATRHWRCRACTWRPSRGEVKTYKRKPIEEYAGEGTFATPTRNGSRGSGNHPPGPVGRFYAAAKGIEIAAHRAGWAVVAQGAGVMPVSALLSRMRSFARGVADMADGALLRRRVGHAGGVARRPA